MSTNDTNNTNNTNSINTNEFRPSGRLTAKLEEEAKQHCLRTFGPNYASEDYYRTLNLMLRGANVALDHHISNLEASQAGVRGRGQG